MTVTELAMKLKVQGAEKAKSSLQSVGSAMKDTAKAAQNMGSAAMAIPKAFSAIAAAINSPMAKMLELTTAVSAVTTALSLLTAKAGFDVAVKLDGLTRGLASVSSGVGDLMAQLSGARNLATLPGLGLEEAIQGKIRLESVGLAAQLADRSLMAFGNALASVGSGKAELDGVTLALSQMVSKGKVFAEELSQIAERAPQVRAAMVKAFGTADTEELQKMGIAPEQFIAGIVTELEKLPKIAGSVGNDIENLTDRIKRAVAPLGQGFIVAFSALQPTIERVALFAEDRFTRIGEIIAATANSGVLAQVADKVMNAFDGLFGGDFTTGVIDAVSSVLSVIANLPTAFMTARKFAGDLFSSLQANGKVIGAFLGNTFDAVVHNVAVMASYTKTVLETIGKNLVSIGGYVVERLQAVWAAWGDGIKSGLDALINLMFPWVSVMGVGFQNLIGFIQDTGRELQKVLGAVNKVIPGSEIPLPQLTAIPMFGANGDKLASLPDFRTDLLPNLSALPEKPELGNLLADKNAFAASMMANLKPLELLPAGLNYGGIPSLGASEKSPVEATLERIERNTKSAADALSLRRQALGGGELAQLGVTPAELRGNRSNPNAGATRGSIGLDSSVTGLARSLDYITKRRVQESMNRLGGGGFRPRTG